MKRFIPLFVLLQIVTPGSAWASAEDCEISIFVNNIPDHKKTMIAKLFRKGADVLAQGDFTKKFSRIGKRFAVTFSSLPCDEYAAVVFVDEDSNGIISHGLILPNEPIGFSGSYTMGLTSGFPTFAKLKFSVVPPTTKITIELNRSAKQGG